MTPALRRAALVGIAAAVLAAAGCFTRGHRVVVHTQEADLDLHLEYPPAIGTTAAGVGFTCPGSKAFLVRILTGTALTPQWTYTLLYDADATHVYGANGVAGSFVDASTPLRLDVRRTLRVQVEGLDSTPADYVLTGAKTDVVCRGIADGALVQPSSGALAADVRMLRVGGGNLPFAEPAGFPLLVDPAAASLTSTKLGIGLSARGEVLVGGGGVTEKRVWRFDPATLAIATLGSALSAGRAAATATLVSDSGSAAVVFAGGYAAGVPSLNDVDVIESNGAYGGHYALTLTHAFQAAMFVPSNGGVVLAGGTDYDTTNVQPFTATSIANVDVFAPRGSTACPVVPGTCSQTSLGGPHGMAGYTPFPSGTGVQLFVGGGLQGANDGTRWEVYSPFPASPPTDQSFPANNSVAGAAAVTSLPTRPHLDGRPLLFGGSTATSNGPEGGAQVLSKIWILSTSGALQLTAENMLAQRTELQAVPLRDRSIALLGGVSAGAPETLVERFEAQTIAGGTAATRPAENLLADRRRFAAVALDGTGTWLDGAVLLVGSRIPLQAPAEIYVPAYACQAGGHEVAGIDGTVPLPRSNPTLDDPCDVARPHESSITDPRTGLDVQLP